ncbi:MAG: hypothetical protein MH186_08225 [Marinobacter sp.]|nr:hypothetical protein [Marinobacter sp.]
MAVSIKTKCPAGPVSSLKPCWRRATRIREHSKQAREILEAIEQSFSELLEKAKQRGELKDATDCARLARLMQSQIMGLRSIAERNLSAGDLEALGDDMAHILDAY